MELPTLSTNFIEFRPNSYNLKNQQQLQQLHDQTLYRTICLRL